MTRLIAITLLFSTIAIAQEAPGQSIPQDTSQDLGKFRNTFYYYVDENRYKELPADSNVLDVTGNILAIVSTKFHKAMDIEGTGKLMDGRVLNFASVVNGKIRYATTVHPDGRGVGNCPLVPYRTIAVDPTKITLGSTVLIEETVGMLLPDGTIHDGIWRADDKGGAIKNDRIDIFTGGDHKGVYLTKAGITHLEPLTIKLISLPTTDSCVNLDPL